MDRPATEATTKRKVTTRVGTIDLPVPYHWNRTFSTEFIVRCQRSEQAL
jgi:transposase-like protein